MESGPASPNAVSQLAQCLIHGRISKPDSILRLVLRLDTFPEHEALAALARLIEIVSASPHNRHAIAGRAGLVNALILNLSRFPDNLRPPLLKILLLAGRQRFTVHDTRAVLAQVQRAESADGGEGAACSLELLQLLCDVVSVSPSARVPSAFWDMGAGVLGMTGFDLPPENLVPLAARGAFTVALWVHLDPLSSLTTLFSLFDANGSGLQLQLHRVGASHCSHRDPAHQHAAAC
eukprot:scaffold773_cov114-Isochrysis_galbana.AAC.1